MTDQPKTAAPKPIVKWAYLVPLIGFVVMAGFFYVGLSRNPTLIEPVLVGKKAPEFALPDLHDPNRLIGTDQITGQYALINIWGTWCPECRHEHDFLLQLSQAGMPILGINYNDDRVLAMDWLATLGDPYIASVTDEFGEVVIDYGVYGAPETFLLSPDLTILAKKIGVLDAESWETEFMPAIQAHREGG